MRKPARPLVALGTVASVALFACSSPPPNAGDNGGERSGTSESAATVGIICTSCVHFADAFATCTLLHGANPNGLSGFPALSTEQALGELLTVETPTFTNATMYQSAVTGRLRTMGAGAFYELQATIDKNDWRFGYTWHAIDVTNVTAPQVDALIDSGLPFLGYYACSYKFDDGLTPYTPSRIVVYASDLQGDPTNPKGCTTCPI